MAMSTGVGDARTDAAPSPPAASDGRGKRSVAFLLLAQSLALVLQATAAATSRGGREELGLALSFTAISLAFLAVLLVLTGPQLTRAARNAAVVCLGVMPTLLVRTTNPLFFTGYDEQLHVRTLTDIQIAHGLFQPNPMLAVSPHYPGLESAAAALQQAGLPLVAAGTLVILAARLVLALVLCDAVEQVTGHPRAAGLAVAAYATSPQFISFNSQFAYQTLALPLALAAVAFVGRARYARDPRPLFLGAAICLCAVAITHHVTSLLTAVFLVLWALTTCRRPEGRRIAVAALLAVAATAAWALTQWSLLGSYLGPIVTDFAAQLRGAGGQRKLFADSSGSATPYWERVVMLYYAAAVSCAAFLMVVTAGRDLLRRGARAPHAERNRERVRPHLLVVLFTALLPPIFALRLLPSGGELGDRATSFIFLAFSLSAGVVLARGSVDRHWQTRLVRWGSAALVTLAVLGGFLLGSGPDWARLPGPYLVSADNRSMDPETLAAADWASAHLPPGSRVGADRVGSILLASQARLWPVTHERGWDIPSLYFADDWSQDQTDAVGGLRLRYLYVDDRLATQLPSLPGYVYRGETPEPQRLTHAELAKFDDVPGMAVAYRHGPVTIYDLSGLGVPTELEGWIGHPSTPTGTGLQLIIGVLVGTAIVWVTRTAPGGVLGRAGRRFRSAAGPALTFATCVGAVCIVSTGLLFVHVWLGPMTFAAAALIVLAGNASRMSQVVGRVWRAVPRDHRPVHAATVIVAAAAITIAVASAYESNVGAVNRILQDPTTLEGVR
jgi:hypothetical protein